jgi:sporulation protein YunB
MILFLLGIILGLVRLDRWIRPDVLAVCAQECRSAAAVQIGESVHTVLSENGDTDSDFVVLLYDESGAVTAVETITQHINQVQAQLLTQINNDLQQARDQTFPVSLGTATGVWLFAGKGPTLQLKMLPIGTADVKLVSQLESAGINQTCHTIRAEITVTLQAAAPFYQTTTTAQFSYLLTETILVGNVPESYVVFGE